jgi:hypothetical protein
MESAVADPTQTVVLDSTKALGVDKVSDCLTQDQHYIVNFVIRKIFGPGTNLDWLEAEIENIKSGDFVEPETIATMALLYARFMREFLNDPVASDLLLYYLNQQSPSQFQPTAITITPTYGFAVIPTTSVTLLKDFNNDVMIAVMTKLEEGLQSRFENPTQLFPILNYGPVQSAYFMRHDEIGIEVVPAISPLSRGDTDTIYGQVNVRLKGNEYSIGRNGKTIAGIPKGIVQALGTVTINFKIQVTSIVVEPGKKWTVKIDSWENWLEDDGNFIDGHFKKATKYLDQSITDGIDALKDSDDRWVKFFALMVENKCPPLVDLLDRLSVTDMFMDQIMNQTITLHNGVVLSPREFKIYTEPWASTQPADPSMFRTEYKIGN